MELTIIIHEGVEYEVPLEYVDNIGTDIKYIEELKKQARKARWII